MGLSITEAQKVLFSPRMVQRLKERNAKNRLSLLEGAGTGAVSSIVTNGADTLLAGDRSHVALDYQIGRAAGLSDEEARQAANIKEVKRIVLDALQGMLMEGVFNTAGKIIRVADAHLGFEDRGNLPDDGKPLRESEENVKIKRVDREAGETGEDEAGIGRNLKKPPVVDDLNRDGRGVGEGGTLTSLRDLMTPEEIAHYDAYWNNVADDMLKSNINSYRQAILNGDITKLTGGKINSKVVTAAIDTNTGDIYYGISGMNNNPTRNAINPQMQAILDSVDGTMTNYPLENCGEFNAINNALNNGVDINALRVYSIDRVGGNYKAPCINCQNLYGNIVHFTE